MMSDQTAWQAKGFRHKLSMILEYTTMIGITVDHQFGLLNGSGQSRLLDVGTVTIVCL